MLRLSGKCVAVTTETVNGPTGAFESTTLTVLTGTGQRTKVEQVRCAQGFEPADWPKEGQEVELEVSVRAYSGRNGVGYGLTAFGQVWGTQNKTPKSVPQAV